MSLWSNIKAAFLAIKAVTINGYEAGSSVLGRIFSFSLSSWGSPGYEKLARMAMRNPHANRGLRLIAQLMAAAPLFVEKREGSEWVGVTGGDQDDVLDLFDRPNPRMSRFPFFLQMTMAIHAGGEFWLDKAGPSTGPNAGRARRLSLIMPDEFAEFIRDPLTGEITGYRFRSRRMGDYGGRAYTRTVDECLHVRFPDPLDDERGLPILVAGQMLSQMEKAAAWNESIASGGGRVPGYWKPVNLPDGKQLTKEQVEAAEANFDARTAERAGTNKEMVLSGSFERQEGSITPKEADWLKGDENSLRKIAALLGLDPALLGDVKGGSLTDAGVDSAVRAAYLLTVLPLLRWLLAELTPFLMPGRGFRLSVNTDQIEALQEDVNAMWERYGKAYKTYGIATLDEAREGVAMSEATPEQREELKPAPVTSPPPPSGDEGEENEEPPVLRSLRSLPQDGFEGILRLVA